jgi:membrane fusion protein (multidrug efflux system)
MMKRVMGLSLGILVLGLAGCDEEVASKKPAASSAMPPTQVEVITPSRIEQSETLTQPGRLQAVRTAQVRARVEGILEKRVYKEGSEIKAGDVLFQIDARTLQANVQSAKATLMRAQADMRIAEQTRKRLAVLVPEKAASVQDLDSAEATLARAKADIESAKAATVRAEIDLSYARITAPIAGRIGRAMVTEGALVGKGEATPLAVIEQVDPIWVNFSLSSNDYRQLRTVVEAQTTETAAHISLDLGAGQIYQSKGKLLFTDQSVDPSTGSIGLRAEFSNSQRSLLAGQFVTVILPISESKTWLTVPQKAVMASPQGQIVMTISAEGKAVPKPVKLGKLIEGAWVVLSGLQGDEQVIVNGLQKARPGSAVVAVPLGGAPASAGGK